MITELTLFNTDDCGTNVMIKKGTLKHDGINEICKHCRRRVLLTNDSGHAFNYCSVGESARSILGCKRIKPTRKACRHFDAGQCEVVKAITLFKQQEVG